MGDVQGQVVVADLSGGDDGNLELVAGDMSGNIICFDASGAEVWDRRIKGSVAQAVSVGDVDGDGQVGAALGVRSARFGHIYTASPFYSLMWL